MKKLNLLALVIITTSCAVAAFASDSTMLQDMVQLDKVYIPALGLSNQPNQMAKARSTFEIFEKAWQQFSANHKNEAEMDAAWSSDLQKINTAVAEARESLMVKNNGAHAHEALEQVREILLHARARNNIAYELDAITKFHEVMEKLLSQKSAAMLDKSIEIWTQINSSKEITVQMQLDENKTKAFHNHWKQLGTVLQEAKTALTAQDQNVFAKKLGQIKPLFIKSFFLFGSFP